MSNKLTNWLLFTALCIIWGSSFKLMKDSNAGLTAMQIASIRIFSASMVLLPFAFVHYKKIPRPKLGFTVLSAVLGNFFPAFLFAIALTRLDGTIGGILNSLTPICVAVVAIFFYKDKIRSNKIWGIIVGFVGLVLLILAPTIMGEKTINFTNLGYIFLILLATFLYGFNVNMVSHHLMGIKPFYLAAVALGSMAIPSGILLWQQGVFELFYSNPIVQKAIVRSIVLGVVCSAVATFLFYLLVQKAGGLFASLVTYGVPFVALFWGLLDKEKISWLQTICMLVILIGVYLANRPEKKKEAIVAETISSYEIEKTRV